MKKQFFRAALSLSFAAALTLSNCRSIEPAKAITSKPAATEPPVDFADLCACAKDVLPELDRTMRPIISPELDPTRVPVDVSFKSNPTCMNELGGGRICQHCFDCFAWQLFIALNWPAASPGKPDVTKFFGKPGDYDNVVWETYASLYDIFSNPNEKPPDWARRGTQPRLIETTNVVTAGKTLDQERQVDQTWLTDQKGNLVRYEIRVNKEIYDYILGNNLYYQEGIYDAFTRGAGISLPDGSTVNDRGRGSIEVKAAWRIVPEGELDTYKGRFKISRANVGGRENTLIALVGLHIAKKTPNSHQWIWATFEHKDNAPDVGEANTEGTDWSFYKPGAPPDYKPNWISPSDLSGRKEVPVQVMRERKIDGNAATISNKVHELIKTKFMGSVWLNYELVDVQWPTLPDVTPPRAKELAVGTPAPTFLANTVMETYMQRGKSNGGQGGGRGADERSSCIGCHSYSSLTPTFDRNRIEEYRRQFPGQSPRWATDYSTIFFKAKARRPTS